MSDYYATLKIQQGRLKAAMAAMDITTAVEISRRSGVQQGLVGDLLNFRKSPRRKNGEWRDATLRVCRTLCREPSDVFPNHLDHEITSNQIGAYVEQAQLYGTLTQQLTPAEEAENNEMVDVVASVMETLSDKEQGVLRARFWKGMTLAEAGREHDVCKGRAAQIESKALRKMRHPARLDKLKGVYAGYSDDETLTEAEERRMVI